MNASELNRKLLFSGYAEATDFLNSSPLNRYLYKFFIDKLPQYRIEVPIVTFFNEIYYQCVRINYDGTPGVDIENRYIDEETEWIKSELASKLIFSIVWALISSRRNLTFHEECYLFKLTPYVRTCDFRIEAEQIVNDIRTLGVKVPDQFPIMTIHAYDIPLMGRKFEEIREEYNSSCDIAKRVDPTEPEWMQNMISEAECKVKVIEDSAKAWRIITNDYSHYAIEKYLRLFSDIQVQCSILDLICLSANFNKYKGLGDYIYDLQSKLLSGKFEPDDTPAISTDNPMGLTPDEYDEYRHNLALDRAATDEELNKEEQLQRDCESLKRQLEEQQKSHEMEMARITAKHQAEIKKLKKQQAESKKQTTKKDKAQKAEEKASTEDAGQMFSVEEMIADVQSQFEMTSAKDFCSMYYRISAKHGNLDEKICKLVDAIVPVIKEREAHHQTINIPTAQQVNINPKEVVNHTKEE